MCCQQKLSHKPNQGGSTWRSLRHITSSSAYNWQDKSNFCPLPGTPMTIVIIFSPVHLPAWARTTHRFVPSHESTSCLPRWARGNESFSTWHKRGKCRALDFDAQSSFNYGDYFKRWPGQQASAWTQGEQGGNHLISGVTSGREEWWSCSNIHLLRTDAILCFPTSSGALLPLPEVSKETLLPLLQRASIFWALTSKSGLLLILINWMVSLTPWLQATSVLHRPLLKQLRLSEQPQENKGRFSHTPSLKADPCDYIQLKSVK